MSQEKLPPRKYEKGQVVSSPYGTPLRINHYYFSPFRNEWAYFGSYIGRDGKVLGHNDKTVGTGESSLPKLISPSLKEYRKRFVPKGVEAMERLP